MADNIFYYHSFELQLSRVYFYVAKIHKNHAFYGLKPALGLSIQLIKRSQAEQKIIAFFIQYHFFLLLSGNPSLLFGSTTSQVVLMNFLPWSTSYESATWYIILESAPPPQKKPIRYSWEVLSKDFIIRSRQREWISTYLRSSGSSSNFLVRSYCFWGLHSPCLCSLFADKLFLFLKYCLKELLA